MPKYKFVETPWFHFYNANPKGKNANDCVYRAISVALDLDYATTMREMTECALKTGYAPNETKNIKAYLESKGWTSFKEPRDHRNKKVSLQEFLKRSECSKENIVALAGSHHCTLIKEGKVWDTWDCTKKPIHTYWRKEKDE